jgi:hypothetical protein
MRGGVLCVSMSAVLVAVRCRVGVCSSLTQAASE